MKTIRIENSLNCPICSTLLFDGESPVPLKCDHLVYGYYSGDNCFVHARSDFAKALINDIETNTSKYNNEDEYPILDQETKDLFISGNYEPGDSTSETLAHFWHPTEDTINDPNRIQIYQAEQTYSGLYLGVGTETQ